MPESAAVCRTCSTLGRRRPWRGPWDRAFANWQHLVAAKLLASGLPEPEARDLAVTIVSTLEGAEMTAQIGQSRTPLLLAGRHLARLVGSYAA
ncbi:hypothetical protein [Streptomyces sp. NPDC058304]|uniref:LmrA/YxaF family transcription factor n=1 Tax=Streptomyces sp. NPDC058304 TaxID=3346437 RepID=UPI0036ED74A3